MALYVCLQAYVSEALWACVVSQLLEQWLCLRQPQAMGSQNFGDWFVDTKNVSVTYSPYFWKLSILQQKAKTIVLHFIIYVLIKLWLEWWFNNSVIDLSNNSKTEAIDLARWQNTITCSLLSKPTNSWMNKMMGLLLISITVLQRFKIHLWCCCSDIFPGPRRWSWSFHHRFQQKRIGWHGLNHLE
jgi:hypothetical protein